MTAAALLYVTYQGFGVVTNAAVSAGHLRLRTRTGARAWPLVQAVSCNIALFLALLVDTITQGAPATWLTLLAALVGSFAFEALHRRHARSDRPGVAAV